MELIPNSFIVDDKLSSSTNINLKKTLPTTYTDIHYVVYKIKELLRWLIASN